MRKLSDIYINLLVYIYIYTTDYAEPVFCSGKFFEVFFDYRFCSVYMSLNTLVLLLSLG